MPDLHSDGPRLAAAVPVTFEPPGRDSAAYQRGARLNHGFPVEVRNGLPEFRPYVYRGTGVDTLPSHYDGLTLAYLAALRECPRSARDLAIALGGSSSRSNVAGVRANLKWMERRGWVSRVRTGTGPWIWEVIPDA